MMEWIQFGATAFFLIFGILCFVLEVIGVFRFGFVMNRMHAAGIGDSLGLLSVMAGLIIASGFTMNSLKLLLIILFMWFTSPVSSHFLSQIEYFTNPDLEKEARLEQAPEKETDFAFSSPAAEITKSSSENSKSKPGTSFREEEKTSESEA